MEDLKKFIPLAKVDEETHMTWGIATSEKEDRDGEVCNYEGAKKAYTTWTEDFIKKTSAAGQELSMGNIRIMHGLQIGGKVIKIEFNDLEKQVWLGTQPANDEVWQLIKGGYITGLSQGGKYAKRWKENEITYYIPEIAEVSYVDAPCLSEASFAYVKADGSTELRKFAKKGEIPSDPELAKFLIKEGSGQIPTRPTAVADDKDAKTVGQGETDKMGKCGCSCTECLGENHIACSAANKCSMAGKAAAVKTVYLIMEKNGTNLLPVTNEEGAVDIRLMCKAWNELHKGNKYEGTTKANAIKRLKQLYAKEGKDTPAEKAERYEPIIKSILEDVINQRAYGQLGKNLYVLGNFARIIEDIKYLWCNIAWEEEQEGDSESTIPDELKEITHSLLDSLLAYCEEEISEEREHMMALALDGKDLRVTA